MRKPSGKPREQFVKERRVGLYILPETRDRLNRIKTTLNQRARSQDDVLNIVFDAFETAGTPAEAGIRE